MDIARKNRVERELEIANQKLAEWVKTLDAKGVGATARRLDPVWRTLNAKCRQLKGRLKTVAQIESNDAEVARLKAEKQAAATAVAEPPKAEKAGKSGKDKPKGGKKEKK